MKRIEAKVRSDLFDGFARHCSEVGFSRTQAIASLMRGVVDGSIKLRVVAEMTPGQKPTRKPAK